MGEPLNPVELEEIIRALANEIARGVPIVSQAQAAAAESERIYDHAFAVAYLAHSGPQAEKKYAAEKATQRERAEKERDFLAFEHAKRQMKALEGKLSAHQTLAKSVTQMYGAAGSGRGQ